MEPFKDRKRAQEYFETQKYYYGLKVKILYYGSRCGRHDTNIKTLSSKGCYQCHKETSLRKAEKMRKHNKPAPKPTFTIKTHPLWPVPSLSFGGGRP